MINKLTQINFQPSLNNLLYGNKEYDDQCNFQAFGIIQEYIIATGRF